MLFDLRISQLFRGTAKRCGTKERITSVECILALVLFELLAVLTYAHIVADKSPFSEVVNKTGISAGDFVCGPRCLLYVLRQMGDSSDLELIDLVEETQWPNLANGSSLASLAEAARLRGLRSESRFIRPRELKNIDWPYPIVLHLTGPIVGGSNRSDKRIGHFVVLELTESTASTATVVDGLRGRTTLRWDTMESLASGYVLLFSPRHEIIPMLIPRRRRQLQTDLFLFGIMLFALMSTCCAVRIIKRGPAGVFSWRL